MADRRLCEGIAAGILNDVTEVPQPEFLVPPVRVDGPVTLADPDPAWADWYTREEDRIRNALGERVVQIEHVGSTSVPGLAAKPVIDIVLVVADSADEATYVPDLEAVGYRLRFREPSRQMPRRTPELRKSPADLRCRSPLARRRSRCR